MRHTGTRASKVPSVLVLAVVAVLAGGTGAYAVTTSTSDPTTPVVASVPSPSASATPSPLASRVLPSTPPASAVHTSASPVRPTPSHTLKAVVAVRVKPHAVPVKPGTCIVGKPCSLKGLVWKKTVGCTKAWLKNMHRTTCPIDPKTGLPFPLVG